jgi:hypothetical protein
LARDVGTKTVSCVPSSTYSSETIVPTWHGGFWLGRVVALWPGARC